MENIKGAFSKVKEDISKMNYEINFLKEEIIDTNEKIGELCVLFEKFHDKMILDRQTDKQENWTKKTVHKTDNQDIKPLNTNIQPISKGNKGVQTDRQTDQQTDRQVKKYF